MVVLRRYWKHLLLVIVAALALVSTAVLGAENLDAPPGIYRIVDGKVDSGTYAGWFVYHLSCHMCHGQDASGTGAAPDLRQSLKTMSRDQFANKLLARYRIFVPPSAAQSDEAMRESIIDEVLRQERGERGRIAMPEWRDDPGISPHVLDLYAYLKARSDGAIGVGRPQTRWTTD